MFILQPENDIITDRNAPGSIRTGIYYSYHMEVTMNQYEIRYLFEHRLLPRCFFENQLQFIGALLKDKEILFRIIDDLFHQEGLKNPYTPDLFDVSAVGSMEQMAIKISFPEPENEPLCYCSYLFFDKTFEKVSYFCIEKGNSEGQMHPFVCSWTPEGAHLNHGHCALEKNEDFLRCSEIHSKQS